MSVITPATLVRKVTPGTLTLDLAATEQEFHHATRTQGLGQCYRVRRNGRTRTWPSRPGEFRIPVKWGLRLCSEITHDTMGEWHPASACPRCR